MTTGSSTSSLLSARLELRAMTPQFMKACLDGDKRTARQILDVDIPAEWPDSTILALRLRQLQADPELQPWLLRAITLRETSTIIGYIGFHTKPNPHYLQHWLRDAVEFGFVIFPEFRRLGFAAEAAQALMHWANELHGVSRFVLMIGPNNQPSQALASRLGFKRIGSHMDEVDGPEDVLALEYISPKNSAAHGAFD
jgi:[ribosomal protein S5]-alanine N-acetyltransferase